MTILSSVRLADAAGLRAAGPAARGEGERGGRGDRDGRDAVGGPAAHVPSWGCGRVLRGWVEEVVVVPCRRGPGGPTAAVYIPRWVSSSLSRAANVVVGEVLDDPALGEQVVPVGDGSARR